MTRASLLVAASVVLAPGFARAAGSDEGTTALPMLQMQQGARPTGMGGAFTAIADDINAIWWNPAGAASSRKTEVGLSHATFVEEMKTEYIAASRPVPAVRGTLATSFTYMTVPGIEGFDTNGNSLGKLTANSYALGLGYATYLVPGQLSAGFMGKYLGQTLTTEKASGIAADFGLQYRQDKLGAGVAVQNAGPSLQIGNDKSPLPLTIRAGLAYQVYPRLVAALDISKVRSGNVIPHLGAELRLTDNFHLRAGFQKQDNLGSGAGTSFGFSLVGSMGGGGGTAGGGEWGGEGTPWWEKAAVGVPGLIGSLDYSFQSFGDLSDVHRLSLGVKF